METRKEKFVNRKWLFIAITSFITSSVNGQDYYISFTGTGASTSVSSVKVKNLTKGTSLNLFGNEILHLTGTAAIPLPGNKQNALKIYPNPVTKDNTTLHIHPPVSGNAVIRVYDLTGKPRARIQTYLGNYTQEFRLSGINNGFYIVDIKGEGYHFSCKVLWNSTDAGPIRLVKISDNNPSDENEPENNYSGIQDTIDMYYSTGDRLKFKGRSENFSTILMDIPSQDKTIAFPFFACSDEDKNNYAVVEIGSQVWMAENLKTTRYNDGTAIIYPGINEYIWNNDTTGAYAWYDNNEAANKNIYGALYNWHAVNTGILCPSGWHVPTDREWMTLRDYLGGTNVAGGKIKETGSAYWYTPNTNSTNESGFSALPGGMKNINGFSDIRHGGNWWSNTFYQNWLKPSGWYLNSNSETLGENIAVSSNVGYSVRCVFGETGNSIPFLLTNEIKDISTNSAICEGMIISDEGAAITAQGFCWDTSENPTIGNEKALSTTGKDIFTGRITGLKPGTVHHVRAFATNIAGTAYGDDLSFTTMVALPVLTTSAVTTISQTTASSGGNITDNGGGKITERGVCWSTTASPTISDNRSANGDGTGSFTVSITGLQPGTTYHLRAYATNSAGTSYGNDLMLTTLVALPVLTTSSVTNIAQATASSGGNITDNGGGTITERGVCWSTTASPSINDSKTTNGTGTGSFNSPITGLRPGTTYHLRAYATNSAGTAYGEDHPFTTLIALPSLITTAATGIRQTTATSGGNITDDGGGTVTERGVCWSTTASPTISDSKSSNGTGAGIFTVMITSLQPGTTYHVRAYAANGEGTAYGNDLSFTTLTELPVLTTSAVTDITLTSVTTGGNITDDGGRTITERGVCWSTTASPTISDNRSANGDGTGSFTVSITGLQPGTTYHLRAYATNSAGTSYGNEVNFNTIPDSPPIVNFTSTRGELLLHSVNDKRIILKAIGSDYYVKFSSDNGVSYNQGVKVTGIFTINDKARILENGNIVLFCVNKIYYSDNNMTSIKSCNVLDKNGSQYTYHNPVNPAYPGGYFNFMGGFAEKAGVCLLGNYANSSSGASPVNLYYSLDGITWKVIYTFGQNPNRTDNGTLAGGTGGTFLGDPDNPLITRHIHAINIGDDGYFYVCTGDVDQEMHFLKCYYNSDADNWDINDMLTHDSRNWQRMRALGVFERNGYLYWGSDGPGTFTYGGVTYDSKGLYKCAVSDINHPSKHILLQPLSDACYSFLNVGHLVFTGLQSFGYIYISFDYGETWLNYAKPVWMTGEVSGVWYNEIYNFFATDKGVVISSESF